MKMVRGNPYIEICSTIIYDSDGNIALRPVQ